MPLPNRSTASSFDAINKINSLIPPANQATDWDNVKLAPGVGDIAALGLTAPRFWARITLAVTTGAMVLNAWQAVWKNATTTVPVLARTGTGTFTITLPTVVSDEYDQSLGVSNNITVNLSAAAGSLETSGGTFGFVNAQASGNVIVIHTANSGAAANDLAGNVILVVGY